jgi:hypothetical protein
MSGPADKVSQLDGKAPDSTGMFGEQLAECLSLKPLPGARAATDLASTPFLARAARAVLER